ncbi:hypothetical protein HDU76_009687 [Blyttiomyces sp. JEL0837]|nr:hypothetical protein HDU76_009687 [Blyttiomyces sp. JEL0837]
MSDVDIDVDINMDMDTGMDMPDRIDTALSSIPNTPHDENGIPKGKFVFEKGAATAAVDDEEIIGVSLSLSLMM